MKALKIIGSIVKGVAKGGINPLPLSHSVTKVKEVKENPTVENIVKTVAYFGIGIYLLYLLSKEAINSEFAIEVLNLFE